MTNRVSQSVSVIAATARDQRAFSASALFSKRLRGAARSVKTDIIASLNVHANIEENHSTGIIFVLSYIVYYLISSDNGSIQL